MALKTVCQTPGTLFTTRIQSQANLIALNIQLPKNIKLKKKDVVLLDKNLHNALELVLAPFFK